MKENLIEFLRKSFPFLLTVGLWRLSVPFWNPAGILAIIPIFFCSFVKPVPWFTFFSILMCMVIDYKFETVCFWMAMYCLFFAINSFQNVIDISKMDNDGLFAFVVFFGISILIQTFTNFSPLNLLNGFGLFVFVSGMYVPISILIKRIHND